MTTPNRPEGPTPHPGAGHRHTTAPLTSDQILRVDRLVMQARLVSGLAHELNNALQVIGGLVELLSDRQDLPDDVRLKFERIGEQADRAGDIVRLVLAYTRPERGGRQAVNLAAVIDRCLALRRYPLGRMGVRVSWDPVSAGLCTVEGDERQLQQALLCLIVNAEEALAGVAERWLRVSLARRDEMIRCEVADTGQGVPSELRGRIFEPLFSTRESPANVGLGLTAAAAIAAAHGGRLWLTETPPPGATFVLELPGKG